MTLSEKLYSLRRKQGLSQEALAEKLDCSRQVISKWENGTTTPDAEMLQKYSELFGEDVYPAIGLDACVMRRISEGGTSPDSVRAQIASVRDMLKADKI